MELIIVGCWGAYPLAGQACSGYLLKHENTRILMDCGHAVFSQLGQYEDFNLLDAVFISHFHPDHYVDLHALRYAIRGSIIKGQRSNPLRVFIPSTPSREFEYWLQAPEIEVVEVYPGLNYQIKDIALQFFPTDHPVPGFAIRATGSGLSLFYTGDTAFNYEIVQSAGRVDLLLAEATMLEGEQEIASQKGHMTTADVARWANQNPPGLLIATHLWEGYSKQQIEKEISSIYKGSFLLAYSGMTLKLGNQGE